MTDPSGLTRPELVVCGVLAVGVVLSLAWTLLVLSPFFVAAFLASEARR